VRLDEVVDNNVVVNVVVSPPYQLRALIIAIVRVRFIVAEMITIIVEVMIVVVQEQDYVAVTEAPDAAQLRDQIIESHGVLLLLGALRGSCRPGR
jgi:hypothetical protein